eukprot:jgi/Chlat1/3517/Chrsp23S03708
MSLKRLWERWRENLQHDATWQEASGALGDLGTFLPLAVALTVSVGLDLGTTLLFTGMYNIYNGLMFGIPMPVQPMKSIAAVALAEGLTLPQVLLAGIATSAIVLGLGLTGLIDMLNRVVPLSVVRGMQLGLGLSLAGKGLQTLLYSNSAVRPVMGFDGLLLAGVAAAFVLIATAPPLRTSNNSIACAGASYRRVLIPAALILVAVGAFLAVVRQPLVLFAKLRLGPSVPKLLTPTFSDCTTGFVRGAVPQLPLTALNSVIAVCKLSEDLFPERQASPRAISISVGLMNLVGCWFGALPCCHGAGGLAAQYKFGARSGAAVVMLGIGKVVFALTLGSTLIFILQLFPATFLGVLLAISGVELASTCRDQQTVRDVSVMLFTAGAALAFKNTAGGFAVGATAAAFWWLSDSIPFLLGRTHSSGAARYDALSTSRNDDLESPSPELDVDFSLSGNMIVKSGS